MSSTGTDHEWVDVGFIHVKMVCKHCDVDQGKERFSSCGVLVNRSKAMEEEGAPVKEDNTNDWYWNAGTGPIYLCR